jgi:pre-rRNA-processing protein IPI3
MLSEYLLASISASTHSSAQSSTGAIIPPVKDAAIFKLAVDPNSRHVPTIYKASSTPQNALAYSPSHIFAAQTGKAVVNAYNVERGTQEATIPFPEKITALITTGATGEYVILGSESGSVWIWEVSVRIKTLTQY